MLLFHAFPLLLHEFGRVDVALHVTAFDVQPLDYIWFVVVNDWSLGDRVVALDVGCVVVDQVFQRQTRVDEFLDNVIPVAINDSLHPRAVVGHLVQHLAVRVREPHVVFEEIDMAGDVRHHHLLRDQLVAFEQIGIRWIGVDDHFVDRRAKVDMALDQLVEFHAKAPVRVACGKAAERRCLIQGAVVQHLVDDRVKIQTVVFGVAFDFFPRSLKFRGEASILHIVLNFEC